MGTPIIFSIIPIAFALMSLIAMIYLMIHARDLARTFRKGRSEMVPGPGPRKVSRKAIWIALVLFNLGWIASIVTLSWGYGTTVIDTADVEQVK